MNLKEIHIGQMVETKVAESGIEVSRICNFFNLLEKEILNFYK